MHSKAIQILYEEHTVILQAINNLKEILGKEVSLSKESEQYYWYINFFRQYGDEFHHQKEEDRFFPELAGKNPIAGDIIMELEEQHEMFRDKIKEIESHLIAGNFPAMKIAFMEYFNDLEDHIAAENDELFITAEGAFEDSEKERMYFSFIDKDQELDESRKREFEERVFNGLKQA